MTENVTHFRCMKIDLVKYTHILISILCVVVVRYLV